MYYVFRDLVYLDFNMVIITFTPLLPTGCDHLRRIQMARGYYSDKSCCKREESIF